LAGSGKDGRGTTPRNSVSPKGLKALSATIARSGPTAMAGYTLIGAIVMLGGIGYAVDAWRGTAPVFLIVGLALGLIVGFYELAKTMWRK
jgi:F0F1-type ATP synthase assembly protein I